MEFLQGAAGADLNRKLSDVQPEGRLGPKSDGRCGRESTGGSEEARLAAFLEKSTSAWRGMMADKKLVTFEQHEERAVEEGRLLARLLIEERLSREPSAAPLAHDQRACCPKCGQPGKRVERVEKGSADPPERAIKTRIGAVRFVREQWRCTTCRVVFFPLG